MTLLLQPVINTMLASGELEHDGNR